MVNTLTLLVLFMALSKCVSARVTLMLGGRNIANNSVVEVSEINEGGRSLQCTTNLRGCCISLKDGNWFYPNGSRVQLYGVRWGMYRTRGVGVVRLNRKRNTVVSGIFHCEVHDNDYVRQKLYVYVYSPDDPPVITQQPGDNHVLPGNDVTFYLAANGFNLHYLWQFIDGSQLPADDKRFEGIYSPDLTIRNVTAFDAGIYQCNVSNSGGTVFSRGVRLSVAGPQVIVQPQSMHSVDPGDNILFSLRSIRATHFIWKKDGVNLEDGNKYSGTRSEHLTVYNVSAMDEGEYICVISSDGTDVPSNPASLTLLDPPTIIQDPENQLNVTPGSNAMFSVVAEGLRLIYTWEKSDGSFRDDDGSIVGKNTSVLTILEVTSTDVGTYYCVVSNKAGSVVSSAAILSLGPPGQVGLLEATTTSTSALISWELPSYLAGFTVTVYEMKFGPVTYPVDPEFINITSTSYEVVGLIPGARYGFEVRAYTAAGAGEWRRTEANVSRTISAVEGLLANTNVNNLTVVEISWNALQLPGWNMTYYNLYYTVYSKESVSNHVLQLPGNKTSISLHLAPSEQSLLYLTIQISGAVSLGLEGVGDFESERSNTTKVVFGGELFQLQFGPVEYCASWNSKKTEALEHSIHKVLEAVVAKKHAHTPVIQEGVFACHTAPTTVTYRARMFGLDAISAVQSIQEWVSTAPTVQIEWYYVDINFNCTSLISSFNDAECDQALFNYLPRFSVHNTSTDTISCVNTCLNNNCT